jgi:hypothetical protein
MPEQSIPKEAAYQIINDELMLDGNPRLNLASFVTTWMEPECDKLIQASVNKNYVDMDEYPVTTELQVRSRRGASLLFLPPSIAHQSSRSYLRLPFRVIMIAWFVVAIPNAQIRSIILPTFPCLLAPRFSIGCLRCTSSQNRARAFSLAHLASDLALDLFYLFKFIYYRWMAIWPWIQKTILKNNPKMIEYPVSTIQASHHTYIYSDTRYCNADFVSPFWPGAVGLNSSSTASLFPLSGPF